MKTQNSSVFLFILLVAALCLIGWAAHGQTNEVATNAPALMPAVKITPQLAAYTFKEWFGVISSILTAIYTMASLAYIHIKHAGGYRQIIADVSGQWPAGFNPPFKGWLAWLKSSTKPTPDAPALNPPESPAQPKV